MYLPIYPNILKMIQMKHLLLILSLWIFSFSLFAQQSDCKYMKGQLVVKAILHPTCFAACNGQLSVGMGVSGGSKS